MLNKEMIDAMGGADSDHYRKFRTLACEAYNILRKSASLLVSLFHLMAGASIPDVQSDPEKALLKLQVFKLVLSAYHSSERLPGLLLIISCVKQIAVRSLKACLVVPLFFDWKRLSHQQIAFHLRALESGAPKPITQEECRPDEAESGHASAGEAEVGCG